MTHLHRQGTEPSSPLDSITVPTNAVLAEASCRRFFEIDWPVLWRSGGTMRVFPLRTKNFYTIKSNTEMFITNFAVVRFTDNEINLCDYNYFL